MPALRSVFENIVVRLVVFVVLAFPILTLTSAPQPMFAASARQIVVYTPTLWGKIIEQTAGRVMQEKFNAQVIWQDHLSSEVYSLILAQKGKPEASVGCPDTTNYLRGIQSGLWSDFDLSKMTNFNSVQDIAKSPPYYGKSGVAIGLGTVGIQYHTAVFKEKGWVPPTSWDDLARPEFKGHVGLTSTTSGTGTGILSLWSRLRGAGRGDVTPGIEFAKQLVKAGQVNAFPKVSSEVNQLMERREIWIATQWMEGGLQFAAQGGPVGWVYPKEGTYIYPTGCSIVKGSPHQDLANEFINLLLGQETQQALALDRWVVPVRTGLALPPQYSERLPLTPERFKAIGARVPDFNEMAEFRAKWHDLWIREVEKQ